MNAIERYELLQSNKAALMLAIEKAKAEIDGAADSIRNNEILIQIEQRKKKKWEVELASLLPQLSPLENQINGAAMAAEKEKIKIAALKELDRLRDRTAELEKIVAG